MKHFRTRQLFVSCIFLTSILSCINDEERKAWQKIYGEFETRSEIVQGRYSRMFLAFTEANDFTWETYDTLGCLTYELKSKWSPHKKYDSAYLLMEPAKYKSRLSCADSVKTGSSFPDFGRTLYFYEYTDTSFVTRLNGENTKFFRVASQR